MSLDKDEGKTQGSEQSEMKLTSLTGKYKKTKTEKKNNVFKSDQIRCRFIYVNRCETNKQHIFVSFFFPTQKFFFLPMTTIMAY